MRQKKNYITMKPITL